MHHRASRSSILPLVARLACAAAALGWLAPAAAQKPSVAVLAASSSSGPDVKAKLEGTMAFSKVDLITVSSETPTVAQLKMYDAVIIYSYIGFKDKVAMGNNLATYFEQGGGVVIGNYETYEKGTYQLDGAWMQKYALQPLQDAAQISSKAAALGKVLEPGSPLLTEVATFGCKGTCHHLTNKPGNGGIVVAEWNDGAPLVIRGNFGGRPVVELNLFLPSTGTGVGEWDPATDGAKLMRNAILYVLGGAVRASRGAVAFPDLTVGDTSKVEAFTYTNSGMMALTLSKLELVGNHPGDFAFQIAAPLPKVLNPNESVGATVTFTPTDKGLRSAILRGTVQGQMNTVDVVLTGNAMGGPLAVIPNPVKMGGTRLGGSLTKTITITNTTNGNANIDKITVTQNDVEFSVAPALNPPLTLAPGVALNATVTFKPQMAGPRTGQLTISSPNLAPAMMVVSLQGSAGDPSVLLNNNALVFGAQHVGAPSAPLALSLTNNGGADLTINGISPGGLNGGDFVVNAPKLPVKVLPGASLSYEVVFKPTAPGMRSGQITVASDDPKGPASYVVAGTGVAFAQTLAPGMMDFGTVKGGGQSMAQVATLTNQSAAPLSLTKVEITGPQAAWFAVLNAPGQLPAPVAANGALPLNVVFRPMGTGAAAATLVLSIDDPKTPTLQVTLKGTGIAGKVAVAPAALAFGGLPVGDVSMPKVVTISNTGGAPLGVTKILFTGTKMFDFGMVDPTLPLAIMPGGKATFDVVYAPDSHAAHAATIEITTDDPMAPITKVPLSGNGTQPEITVTPMAINFGQVPVSLVSMAKTVTIKNTGDGDLTVTPSLDGMHASQFRASTTKALVIKPKASATVDVTYAPTMAGAAEATLLLSPTSQVLMPVEVQLNGTAVSASVSITPPTIAFGITEVGKTTEPQTVTVKNTGAAALPLAELLSPSQDWIVDTSAFTRMLAAGTSTTFTVAFKPSRAGPSSASIIVRLEAGNKALGMVNVNGEGIEVAQKPPGGGGGRTGGGCAIARRPSVAPAALIAAVFAALLLRRRRRS